MSGKTRINDEMDFDPIWLQFSQETLESRYRQHAVSENVNLLSKLYIISALFATFPAIYLALNVSSQPLVYFSLLIGAMPLIAGVLHSIGIKKAIKHKHNNMVSMLFVILLNMTAAIQGLLLSWYGFSMAWVPLGPVLFCFGLALWLPSVKSVSNVLLVTALANFIAILSGGISFTSSGSFFLSMYGVDFTLLGWLLFSLVPLIPISRQRNVDRRRLYLIGSQLKDSEHSLHNESFERRRLWHLLKQNVQTDPVTRLFEHKYFFKLCLLEIERAKRYQRPMTLLVLQVKDFIKLENKYGDEWGSKVEMRVASMLRQQLRQQDIIGRVVGNHFGVLLPETGLNEAKIVLERIAAAPIEQKAKNSDELVAVSVLVALSSLDLASKSKDMAELLESMFNSAASSLK